MARVLLGVTGGIAAYKACELCRLLVKAGHDVVPLVTPGAERFVTARDVPRARPARRPATTLYPAPARAPTCSSSRRCTANTLAKLAHGLADNVLTEAALAHRGPVLVAPAMNPRMWAHPATQANAATAARARRRADRARRGRDWPRASAASAGWPSRRRSLAARPRAARRADTLLAGRRVLVSAGGTREPLDAVRFVGNRSSGRMGVALAAEARRRGAEVTLLAANLAVPAPGGSRARRDADRRRPRARGARPRADADVVVMAAAVADYRPAEALAGEAAEGRARRGRSSSSRRPTSSRRSASGAATGQVLVGFAAETGRGAASSARGRSSRARTLDLFVFNDVSRAGHRLRRARQRGRARRRGRRAAPCRRRRRTRSPPRSSTRSSGCSRRDERRVRAVPAGPAPPPQRHGRAGDRRAREGEAARAGEGVDPRGARDRVPPHPPLREAEAEFRESSSSRRPTTSRTTRSAAASSSRADRARRTATTSSPARCARTASTTRARILDLDLRR